MISKPITNSESADVEIVNEALGEFSAGNLGKVESLLRSVIGNTPSNYSNFEEDKDVISIKFWDHAAFIHYVTWHKNQGSANKNINWIGNAYPRAYYYMGFFCVKQKQFDRAIEFLDKGESLEPTNPNFSSEKAIALAHSGRKQEALSLYDRVSEIGPFVSARDIAVARRGRGFILIEMGDLDNAEIAFKLSLKFEPENKVAINELLYINQLRQGGRTTYLEAITSTSPDYSNCAICGKKYNEVVIVTLKGKQVFICKICAGEYLK